MHERLGTTPLYPDSPEWYRQLAVITLPDTTPDDLRDRLFYNHGIEVPISGHGDMIFVRVSVQGYTTQADLDALADALYAELAPGA
jgi:isopenicillin-N epimerase